MARAKSFVSPIQTIDENTSKQTNLSTGPAFYNLDPIDNDFRTSWTSLQSLTILNFFVGPPFDDSKVPFVKEEEEDPIGEEKQQHAMMGRGWGYEPDLCPHVPT